MKKIRRCLATAIVYVACAISFVFGILMTLVTSVIIGNKDEACYLIVDVGDNVKHVLFGD